MSWGSTKVITNFATGETISFYYKDLVIEDSQVTEADTYVYKLVVSKVSDNTVVLEKDTAFIGGLSTFTLDSKFYVSCEIDTTSYTTEEEYFVEFLSYSPATGWKRLDDFILQLKPSNNN